MTDKQTNKVIYRAAAKPLIFEKLESGESLPGQTPSMSCGGNYGVGGRGEGDKEFGDEMNTSHPTEDQLI